MSFNKSHRNVARPSRIVACAALAFVATFAAACVPNPAPHQLLLSEWGKNLRPAQSNVSYGPHSAHRFDAYPAASGGNKGTIVFVHGGGFTGGDKTEITAGLYGPILRQTHLGWNVVSINYRLAGQARYPAAYADAALAITWLQERGKEIGLNTRRIVVAGHSAGATLAALVGTTPGAATEFGFVPRVERWVAMSPITNFSAPEQLERDYPAMWGAASALEKSVGSPLVQIGAGDPPGYVIHGDLDTAVQVAQSDLLVLTGIGRGAQVTYDRVDSGPGECRWHYPACGMNVTDFDNWLS